MSKPLVCVGFVTRDDYADLLSVCDDVPNPPPPFEVWNQRQIDGCAALEAEGFTVARVSIKPKELAAWCKASGRKVDGVGRSAYAAFAYIRLNK